jgi:hypothetical protein
MVNRQHLPTNGSFMPKSFSMHVPSLTALLSSCPIKDESSTSAHKGFCSFSVPHKGYRPNKVCDFAIVARCPPIQRYDDILPFYRTKTGSFLSYLLNPVSIQKIISVRGWFFYSWRKWSAFRTLKLECHIARIECAQKRNEKSDHRFGKGGQ